MATSKSISCAVCAGQSISKEADKWCDECEEAFCMECVKHHSIAKATRGHTVIEFEHYKELPAFVLEIKQHCDLHAARYQIYCRGHECPCCVKCIDSVHKTCKDLIPLDDVIKDTKSSIAMEDIEERLQDLTKFIQAVSKITVENLQEIKAKRKDIETEIKQLRGKINQHLDNLEDQLIRKLYDTERYHRTRIENLSKELKAKEDRTKELQKNIVSIKHYASNLQVFLATEEMEVEVMKEKQEVEDLTKSDSMNTHSLFLSTNDKIQSFLTDVKSFGELLTKSEPIVTVFHRSKDKQAQITASLSQDVTRFNITLKLELVIPKDGSTVLSSCAVLANRGFLYLETPEYDDPEEDILSQDGRLILLNEKGNLIDKIKVYTYAYDVACIDDKTVAVSSSTSRIQIVNIEQRLVERTIKLGHACYSIAYFDGKLFYKPRGHGLEMRCLTTDQVTTLKMGIEEDYACIAVHNNRVYIANSKEEAVICFDMDGSIIWKWSYTGVLSDPGSITVDRDSNVYIVGEISSNIVVISSNGKQFKPLVHDTIAQPKSISYDKKCQHLLICSEFGKAGLFSII